LRYAQTLFEKPQFHFPRWRLRQVRQCFVVQKRRKSRLLRCPSIAGRRCFQPVIRRFHNRSVRAISFVIKTARLDAFVAPCELIRTRGVASADMDIYGRVFRAAEILPQVIGVALRVDFQRIALGVQPGPSLLLMMRFHFTHHYFRGGHR
jgi:hypothetical protein